MVNKRYTCDHPNNKCQVTFNNTSNSIIESSAINLSKRIQRFSGQITYVARMDITNLGVAAGSSMTNIRSPPRNF